MNGHRYMLDTDILIYMLRGLKISDSQDERRLRAERIRNRIERVITGGGSVRVSMITVCELEYGAARSANPVKQRRALYKTLAPFEVVEADALNLPRKYGEVRNGLEKAGQPIGAMDLLIAAHALAVNATLVSNNVKEFGKIKGLQIANWAE